MPPLDNGPETDGGGGVMVNLPPLLYPLLHTVGYGKKGTEASVTSTVTVKKTKRKGASFYFSFHIKKKRPATHCESVKSQGTSFSDPPPPVSRLAKSTPLSP